MRCSLCKPIKVHGGTQVRPRSANDHAQPVRAGDGKARQMPGKASLSRPVAPKMKMLLHDRMSSGGCPGDSQPCNTSNVGFGVGECCDKNGNIVKHATSCEFMLDYDLIERAHNVRKFPPCRALIAMCTSYHNGDPTRTRLCAEASSNPHCHVSGAKDASTCEYRPLRTPQEYPMLNWAQQHMREHFAGHHSDARPKAHDAAHYDSPTS